MNRQSTPANRQSTPAQPHTETDPVRLPTQHGLLVAWGYFAHQIGLIEGLLQVPVPQKRVYHAPQKKLLEFQMAILAGVEYLQDINVGSHPLIRDRAVTQTWGQDRLAHYSAVSRTLETCVPETVTAVQAVLAAVSQPFIQQIVDDCLLGTGYLTLDLDLLGRAVSNTSQSYPEAAFGWMGEAVGLGYQLAQVSTLTARYGRQWLAGFHHPVNTVSMACLQELILAAEQRLGLRPRRRVELLEPQLRQLAEQLVQAEAQAQKQAGQAEQARERHALLGAKLKATARSEPYASRPRPCVRHTKLWRSGSPNTRWRMRPIPIPCSSSRAWTPGSPAGRAGLG